MSKNPNCGKPLLAEAFFFFSNVQFFSVCQCYFYFPFFTFQVSRFKFIISFIEIFRLTKIPCFTFPCFIFHVSLFTFHFSVFHFPCFIFRVSLFRVSFSVFHFLCFTFTCFHFYVFHCYVFHFYMFHFYVFTLLSFTSQIHILVY